MCICLEIFFLKFSSELMITTSREKAGLEVLKLIIPTTQFHII